MAKLHTQTLIITISKLTKSNETVELLDNATLSQLEAILGELITDKEHTLIEVQVDQ